MPLPPPPPDDALASLLPPEVDLATGRGLRHGAAAVVWQAVVWGRLGRCDLAWAHLDRVNLPALRPWIAAERGRVLRELGHHASAEAIEWPALLTADDAVDAAMLRVSLVADAVGVGDLGRARRRLTSAREAVGALADGPRAARQRRRLAWVGAEVALLGGDGLEVAREALAVTRDAQGQVVLGDDHAHGTDFHRAKSLLFAGVLDRDDQVLRHAEQLAPPMLRWAVLLARRDLAPSGEQGALHQRATDAARTIVTPAEVAFALPS